jgi:hypothetical protein
MNHETFKWVQYFDQKHLIFFLPCSQQKINSALIASKLSDKYLNIWLNLILYFERNQGRNQETRWVLMMKKLEIKILMQVYL